MRTIIWVHGCYISRPIFSRAMASRAVRGRGKECEEEFHKLITGFTVHLYLKE